MKKYSLPKTLVLDYKKWRCGSDKSAAASTRHGTGSTSLLNSRGYMCCLGQFCLQAGVPHRHLRYKQNLSDLGMRDIFVEDLSRSVKRSIDPKEKILDSMLSQHAMNINDNFRTSIAEKVVSLIKLFENHKITLILKNFPEKILAQIKLLQHEKSGK